MTPAPIKNPLTPEEAARFTQLRADIKTDMAGFMKTALALVEISDKRYYREEYSTFQEFCQAEYDLSASRVYRLCQAAEVVKLLPSGQQTITNERQARELAKAPEE